MATIAILAGCQTTPTTQPAPVPVLQLIQSQPLTLAEGCEASGSYFVEFKVLSDGSTSDIVAPHGPPCVQLALATWVISFRYAPPGQVVPSGVEWMMVTARKGS